MLKRLISSILCFLTIVSSLTANPKAKENEEVVDAVILGGGIGALTSSIYLQRAGVQSLVIEGRDPGGAIAQSPQVQNWPGEIEIDGYTLIEKVRKQAEANGAKILPEEVVTVDFSSRPFKVTTRNLDSKNEKHILFANSCIIATGASPRLLGVPGETDYWTRGVYTCATCDGALFKDRTVAVIGGGDTAVLEAEYLSKIAGKVIVVLRSKNFRTSETVRMQHLLKNPKVEVYYNSAVQAINGNGTKATKLMIKTNGKPKELAVDAIFLAIGSTPNSRLFAGQLELDKAGYIVLKDAQQTSLPGVFAIGDVVDPHFKQAISAAGDGAKAALQVERELATVKVSFKENSPVLPAPVQMTANTPASTGAIDLTNAQQLSDELASATMPIIVDFYSPYCGPCRKIAPQVEQAAKAYSGKIRFLKANVSDLSGLSSEYNVYGVPTVIVFNAKGQEIDRRVGPDQIASLLNSLDKLVSE